MTKVFIAGLGVDSLTKEQLLQETTQRLTAHTKTFIVTAYSEFLFKSMVDKGVRSILNTADFVVPDGVGILWAHRFLSIPFHAQSFYGKIVEGFWQIVYSGLGIVVRPSSIREIFTEKIVGADLFWDLAALAEQQHVSVYLLGGFGNTPHIVAKKLTSRFPNLSIAGVSNKNVTDKSIVDDIIAAKPGMLFVALGPITQEQWIATHIDQLPIKLAIGLGGTFDYVAGTVAHPPRFIRNIGLEWAYRLFTQPKRIKRIWNATFGLCRALLRYKIFTSLPYRPNVVVVVQNAQGEILVCKRNVKRVNLRWFGRDANEPGFENYWQFPQGGIDKDETKEDAAVRELREETGITSALLISVSKHTHTYDWPSAKQSLLGSPSRFRGQKQYVAYFSFTGSDNEITVDNHEFVDYKWVKIGELLEVLSKERHPLAQIVQEDLSHNKQG